jgi:peptidyl-prolyl cis-trans isomerase SurA
MGTYARDEWPGLHGALRDPLFQLAVGQVSRPVQARYGWTLIKRCLVEKAHIRHILVRYAGALNAEDSVTRDRTEADRLIHEYRERVIAEGADFQAIAREVSEDGSAEQGGDLGSMGRGLLAQPVDDAAFALEVGQVSDVVESRFGFHVIQRVE